MPERGNPGDANRDRPELKDNVYISALKNAMAARGLGLSEAYIEFCEQVVKADRLQPDPAKEAHLAEIKKAYEYLKAQGKV